MARRVQQVRFYGTNSEENYPSGNIVNRVTASSIQSGTAFRNYTPMVQLGVQGPPGTKFYLNGSTDPIIIGSTGIYELNVENMTQIVGLRFDRTTINLIENSPSNVGLLVDILYES